ncbi:right-handed parallel beta-helix repeat-containing protein [Nonomuraea sp. NPDC003214]
MTVRAVVAAALCAALTTAALAVPAGARTAAVACGDVVTADVTLDADLNCAGGGLVIGADGVVVDLAGHTVTGSGAGRGIDVAGHAGVTVRDGAISGFTYGIHQFAKDLSSPLTIEAVRFAAAPVRVFAGVLTIGGTPATCRLDGLDRQLGAVTVDRCSVTGGVVLRDANSSAIRDSRLTTGWLNVVQSDRGVYTGNTFDAFPVSTGVESRRNRFAGNVFRNAAVAMRAGEVYQPEAAGVVERNLFTGNDIGLRATGFRNVVVRDNVFSGNHTAGMLLMNQVPAASPEGAIRNVFWRNGHRPSGVSDPGGNPVRGGIHVWTDGAEATRIMLARNVGAGNAGPMIWAPAGQVVDGGGNQGPCAPAQNPGLTCF